jgi:TRAP-type C4-dicarboxylate transport system substrate-binding protein
MSRRRFLKAAALISAAVPMLKPSSGVAQRPAPTSATDRPIRIRMGGYAPPDSGFSLGLKFIGDRLEAEFGDEVSVQYAYNVMNLGYTALDLRWLVDAGVLTMGYVSISDVPELELAGLPFLFRDTAAARSAMDGPLGRAAAASLEANGNFRILGYFENGFRHISNNIRPVHTLEDLRGLKIRIRAAEQIRTFQLLGADPQVVGLSEAVQQLANGTLDGQENPFINTITYPIYPHQRFFTATFHSYLSRPIFVHRPSFDAWPTDIQAFMRDATRDAVAFQRDLHDREEEEAQMIIREAGGEIVSLTPEAREAFAAAVAPIHAEARERYPRELLQMVGLD